MRRPGVNFDLVAAMSNQGFIDINPATGNRQLAFAANDVMDVVERLGGLSRAAAALGVEEIEVHHWIDDHYVPTRYAKKIRALIGWDMQSIQVPPLGADWPNFQDN